MIFKIMQAAGAKFHAVDYNEKKQEKGGAKLIYFQGFESLQGQEIVPKEMFQNYLASRSSLNGRIKNPSFHASLSCKGKEMSHEQLKDYAIQIMEHLGYKNQPILVYAHNDTNNNHVHIVTTRVNKKGEKIADKFEKKRANSYLNAIMNRHPGLEFEATKNIALRYKFSTVAQFNMLMEAHGYKVKKNDDAFNYYKHGKEVGFINEKALKDNISNDYKDENRIKQIRALIFKYQNSYSSQLNIVGLKKDAKEGNQPEKEKKFKSELTDFLKDKFGLEFIFFSGKNHDKPYGYAIIDHAEKMIYKGSDVRNLEHLITGNISRDYTETTTSENMQAESVNKIYQNSINTNSENLDYNSILFIQELNKVINEITGSEKYTHNPQVDSNDEVLKKKKKKRKI